MNISLLTSSPLIVEIEDLLDQGVLTEISLKLKNRHWLAQQGVPVKLDETGLSFELRKDVMPPLTHLENKIKEKTGITSAKTSSIRIRHYHPGQGHPPHCDHYELNDEYLLFTAVFFLCDTEEGGATSFTKSDGIKIVPKRNKLIFWLNYLDDGNEDLLSEHEAETVKDGEKLIAIYLFYGEKSETSSVRHFLLENYSTEES
ncbi:2OG-Fe(II) oxygenase [Psychrosphaera sp. B3R10]|uniref:2OG-Fe(II) oxygenase n=1 Tax=Psychrosphaera algicola TaxID=3023714 RepID=A0ABT5FBH6_9GAMM|nr:MULTISPECIES: 2OG-Fe(II) oxygenase [unclassified Psychrosphaera]MBU2881796.1 2OG-Fe(II) oxygenase [Psychrosphaera sp. I2R16]MBU2988076.1 2OG-Fe(II) oxygenase [Psychrosphaera sp. B3R10]MDC2888193.1 2OG-Fe(II) oxygenase [Psychrosphaera sp. G1-22]MDO6721096.1 2OG-Fe(II) oxygenase [Psychrosphaera sp. 1_MG-2023]